MKKRCFLNEREDSFKEVMKKYVDEDGGSVSFSKMTNKYNVEMQKVDFYSLKHSGLINSKLTNDEEIAGVIMKDDNLLKLYYNDNIKLGIYESNYILGYLISYCIICKNSEKNIENQIVSYDYIRKYETSYNKADEDSYICYLANYLTREILISNNYVNFLESEWLNGIISANSVRQKIMKKYKVPERLVNIKVKQLINQKKLPVLVKK